jgi:hypothetical protein
MNFTPLFSLPHVDELTATRALRNAAIANSLFRFQTAEAVHDLAVDMSGYAPYGTTMASMIVETDTSVTVGFNYFSRLNFDIKVSFSLGPMLIRSFLFRPQSDRPLANILLP